jgi:glutathione S-transferase
MMTLHWSPRSPYVRKVMIAAAELGLSDRIQLVRTLVGGTTAHPELMRQNPVGKIPTLVLQDGTILYDSAVIVEYLDSLHPGPKLFPTGPARFTALRRHALGQGMIDCGLLWLGERTRLPERQSAAHIELWRLKLRTAVDALETDADRLAADPFSAGHIAIGVALGYLDFRFADENWRHGHPRLAAWHEAFNARPAVASNMPAEG